ncbi:MAG: hypothetical protein ACLS70_10370 [[Clostridium] symbiosum]
MGPRQAPADSHVPSAIDSAYFPGQIFAGDGRLRRRFSTPDMVRSGC